MKLRTLGLCALLLSPASATAQVLITEVQFDPTSPNDDGEWVELQNTGAGAVDLSGWTLADFSGADPLGEAAVRWAFPAGTSLAAGQVIVVAKFASPAGAASGYAANTPAGLYTAPASFELSSTGHDDPAVPNLTGVGGSTLMALGNSASGDAVVLRDGAGALVSGVEWGSVDRSVPGAPAAVVAAAHSLRRVANSRSSAVDFVDEATPTPFTGWTGGPVSGPPVITSTMLTPRHLAHGAVLGVSTTATDPDGVSAAEVYTAIATSSVGAASGGYAPTAMVHGVGDAWMVDLTPSAGNAPATFHDRYVRAYVRAADTTGAASVDPVGATPAAANTAYFWRNLLPSGEASLAEARAAHPNGGLRWQSHSVRLRGIALTRKTAFVANTTNFFIQSTSGSDAIRVFARAIVLQDVQPGDEVRVTGLLDQFNNLRQVGEPELAVEILSSGHPVPETTHTVADLLANGEQLESQLVRVNGLSFVAPQTTWPTNGNVEVTDGTGTIVVRVTSIVDLSGTAAPSGTFGLRGVLGQFNAAYQLYPRDARDVFPGAGPMAPDAGTTAQDAGVAAMDGGVAAMDGGVAAMDGGVPATDGGVGTDGGRVADAGAIASDAGAALDSGGAGSDDAGMAPDAGRRAPSGDDREEGGCACVRGRSSSALGGAGLLLALSLVLGARRRRAA